MKESTESAFMALSDESSAELSEELNRHEREIRNEIAKVAEDTIMICERLINSLPGFWIKPVQAPRIYVFHLHF